MRRCSSCFGLWLVGCSGSPATPRSPDVSGRWAFHASLATTLQQSGRLDCVFEVVQAGGRFFAPATTCAYVFGYFPATDPVEHPRVEVRDGRVAPNGSVTFALASDHPRVNWNAEGSLHGSDLAGRVLLEAPLAGSWTATR